ncbi:DinB family protein [Pyxidicoccus trucidator]|uniref:DinB family protein n=1 Tax=Pyxidicoccus trucidator TaxID=2709662 RepID=UPI0013DCAB66|nr:DinB family protein [Pyxidicoccus trucidator]
MDTSQRAESPAQTHPFVQKLRMHREFFHRTLECFRDEDASFRVAPETMTAAGQVLHAAAAIEFFLSGVFGVFEGWSAMSQRQRGFVDMSWTQGTNTGIEERSTAPEVQEAGRSLKKAAELFDRSMDSASAMFGARTMEELVQVPLPPNPIFPPWFTASHVFEILIDHTAHHRGALAQYARGLGLEPKIPYFEMAEALHEAMLTTGQESGAGAPVAASK